MVWKFPVSGRWRTAADYAQIIVGSVLVGLGVNWFFVPNQVVSGGVTGIAILLHYAFGTPVGLVTLLFNLPLLAVGWKWAGGMKFLVRTAVAHWHVATHTGGRCHERVASPASRSVAGRLP